MHRSAADSAESSGDDAHNRPRRASRTLRDDENKRKPRSAKLRTGRRGLQNPSLLEPKSIVESLGGGSKILIPLLLCGVIFCLIDSVFIFKYVQLQERGPPDVVAPPAAPKKRAYSSIPHESAILHQRVVQTIPSDWAASPRDSKEPIVALLREATGVRTIDADVRARLPTAAQVEDLYGRDPVVLGLETCARFQALPQPAEHFLSTAGTFNTGTNLMSELLIANCHMPERMKVYKTPGVRWQVLWGKHTPVFNETFRLSHRTYKDDTLQSGLIFPAVTVRDPFKWMQSVRRNGVGCSLARSLVAFSNTTHHTTILSLSTDVST